MSEEIQFTKYKQRGADYHYKQINKCNLKTLNAYTLARYEKQIRIVGEQLKALGRNEGETLKVLDMGCGDGVLLYLLKKRLTTFRFECFGIDVSEQALQTAKQKIPDANFLNRSVYETGFDMQFFDLILSSDLIEHLQHPDKMLEEIKRVAKEAALIIIGTPIRYTEKPLDPMHVKEFFQQEFIELCSTYFQFIALEQSHKQIHALKYTKKSRIFKIGFNRYLYNLLTVLGRNRFLEKIKPAGDFPTYMYAVCRK
jgi:2-polyprenyl-3-methyl-5-hydroxy-6-metoxy-1,4-benzoquinol methylase